MSHTSVLLVDDDEKIVKLLRSYFEKEAFAVAAAGDGREAVRLHRELRPDIVVLDLMLPGLSGLDVCRAIRREADTPILMLTARDEEADRLIGLELGADDYVAKPFSPREVVARARAILRRTGKGQARTGNIVAGRLTVDVSAHIANLDGAALDLTPTEFKVLALLAASPGQVFSRLQVVEQVQGYAFEGYERTVDAHIKNLRRKLGDNPKDPRIIQTVYGVGYRFAGDGHV